MTPDNRALWELVDVANSCIRPEQDLYTFGYSDASRKFRDSLRAILERPKVLREVRLWDTQWMNIVNHDNCYRDWSKEDAIAHAVKTTEEAIARNVADGKLPPRKDKNESMVRGKS